MARTEKRRKPERLPQQIAWAVAAAEDKKAGEIVVLDLRKASGFTDYFVICSGQNARQIRAIADAVVETLASHAAKPAHVEGYERSEWVLLDYFDFNLSRCSFCGLCAEVCPTKPIKALIMSEDYELGSYSRDTQILRVDEMYDGVPIEQYTH